MIDFTHLDEVIAKEAAFSKRPNLTPGQHLDSITRLRNLQVARDVLHHNEQGHLVYIGPRGMILPDGRLY